MQSATMDGRSAASYLPSLPDEVLAKILEPLPADQRLRLAFVHPSWGAMLWLRRLWVVVDLSPSSGVAVVNDKLLEAISRRAGGAIVELDVSERVWGRSDDGLAVSPEALEHVLRDNAATLRVLRVLCWKTHGRPDGTASCAQISYLLRFAPGLILLEADIDCKRAN